MEKAQIEGLKITIDYMAEGEHIQNSCCISLDTLDAHRYPVDAVLRSTSKLWEELETKIYA